MTDFFLELFGLLPRGGPGDDASTRKAFDMMAELPPRPRVLDIGCGPGAQTVVLLDRSGGTVVAVDLLPRMIARVRVAAERAGVEEHLSIVQADMRRDLFTPGSFDVVWSEGAIYLLGFADGLARVRELVRPGGYVAVSDAVWLEADPPEEIVEFWRAYPEMDSVAGKLDVVSRAGFETVGYFVLPESSWLGPYYAPLTRRLAECEREWKGNPEAGEVLAEARTELSMFHRYSRYYGYAFFVMRRPA